MSSGGAIAGGLFQGYEANKARQAAGQAYNVGINSLKDSKNEALGYLNPYNEAGQSALTPLTGLLTGNQYDPKTGQSTTLTPEQRDNLLYQSPGYRFALDQGQQGLEKSQVARGISLSGGAQKELAGYLSGSASQYADSYINHLSQLAGLGQNSAHASANVVSGFGTQIAGGLTNQGLTKANYYNQIGNIGAKTFSAVGSDIGGGGMGGASAGGAGSNQQAASGIGSLITPALMAAA
jgi:hypothetical protein